MNYYSPGIKHGLLSSLPLWAQYLFFQGQGPHSRIGFSPFSLLPMPQHGLYLWCFPLLELLTYNATQQLCLPAANTATSNSCQGRRKNIPKEMSSSSRVQGWAEWRHPKHADPSVSPFGHNLPLISQDGQTNRHRPALCSYTVSAIVDNGARIWSTFPLYPDSGAQRTFRIKGHSQDVPAVST